jgi:hypothetical protein
MTTRAPFKSFIITVLASCSILAFGQGQTHAEEEPDSCVCLGWLQAGEKVISTYELTSGPGAGRTGEVVGGYTFDFLGNLTRYALVSFDGWHEGHGGAGWESCLGNIQSNQCWWVECGWLRKLPIGEFPCDGDLNLDGIVDGADLVILLGNWGFCPL